MRNLVGKVIDRYSLLRILGEGGMGTVFEAEHIMVHKRCAIKVLHPELSSNMEVVQRMLREAQAAAKIGHPNIVETHDFGVTPENHCYMVMDLLKGESLHTLIGHFGRMDVKSMLAIALQVLSALVAAHAKKIIHRDLKPENIFISQNKMGGESVKLLDFGISKFMLTDSDTDRLTKAGVVMGTPLYMSPEQASGAEKVTSQSDIWSMGVVLYEALTGELPFDGNNYNQIIIEIATKDCLPPRHHRQDIPEELEAVILRAMQKDPARRFRSAAEMIDALLPFYDRTESESGRFVLPETLLDKIPAKSRAPASTTTSAEVEAGVGAAGAADAGSPAIAQDASRQAAPPDAAPTGPSADVAAAPDPIENEASIAGTAEPDPVAPSAPAEFKRNTPFESEPIEKAAPMESAPLTDSAPSPPEGQSVLPSARQRLSSSNTIAPAQVAGREYDLDRSKRPRMLMIMLGAGSVTVAAVIVISILAVGGKKGKDGQGTEQTQTDSTERTASSQDPTADKPNIKPISVAVPGMTKMGVTMGMDKPMDMAARPEPPMSSPMHQASQTIRVRLRGLPRGAKIRLDGAPSSNPLRLLADGRLHKLQVSARGYHAHTTRFRATKDLMELSLRIKRKGKRTSTEPAMKVSPRRQPMEHVVAVVKHLTSKKGGRWWWPLQCEVADMRRLSGSVHA